VLVVWIWREVGGGWRGTECGDAGGDVVEEEVWGVAVDGWVGCAGGHASLCARGKKPALGKWCVRLWHRGHYCREFGRYKHLEQQETIVF